ncbi:myosin-IB-like [Ctenocephalides felis]|uniref:myosin-IB-like n=1 Tax=Ctenocephalides felis TaxID=7515 RepID=UPI000E6E3A6C|nr:myosin-IB-like [Ctenocephalides felis]
MELSLHERDRVGVQDSVLLEDYTNESVFVDNLKKRFGEDLIYTYIGQVLVSINPYKELNIYREKDVFEYTKKAFFQASPHVFAVADNAYRSLTEEHRGQCILISGESGSGKTEASKKVLQFVAAVAGHQSGVEGVKDKLLQSNPVLEAFGNAKTNRNDNSSRFGKYMDVQFNHAGDPEGGNILNYLLEKSRVVHQSNGERNFHIFYQLLRGGEPELLQQLHLKNNLDNYYYITDGNKGCDQRINDAAQFKAVRAAMSVIEISEEEQIQILRVVAAVLHLGNVGFTESEGKAEILKPEAVQYASELLGCSCEALSKALTHRTIEPGRGLAKVSSPLSREMAIHARDALAKAVYDRMFTWLVSRLNASLQPVKTRSYSVMGILDIYGFEIFQKNSFEQFCINFCNEKLQQLFIELTLKSEQDEYLREGIEWESVDYFNNKVICDLIEEKHRGIISYLDEECLRPGETNDMSFLDKMNINLMSHDHYISHVKADTKTQKTMSRDEFRLIHYAGDVTYSVNGFLEKNSDLLFRDLREVMSSASNTIASACFPAAELQSKRRPETAATQFRQSLHNLMNILMTKEPSYIRCIKPNELKQSGFFDVSLVTHQVKYLGLMENLRVRRAGFAYRRTYESFLHRYKCLSKNTWPNYNGTAKDGVEVLVKDLGYNEEDYRLGRTKLFIRSPKTLFTTEDAFQAKKHYIVSIIQSRWKGLLQRRKYNKQRAAAILMQQWIRRFLAQRNALKRKEAVTVIRRFIEGFITRHGPPTELNKAFIIFSKAQWLLRLSKSLPQRVRDTYWPPCPNNCKEASALLYRLHRGQRARIYRMNLSKEKKRQIELKIMAEDVFKNKKASYASSFGPWFVEDRLNPEQKKLIAHSIDNGERLVYTTEVTKYDRHGYKPRNRWLLVSDKSLYLVEVASNGKGIKMKHKLQLDKVSFVITANNDNLLMVRIPADFKKDKGDLILEVPHLIECLVWILDLDKTKSFSILQILDRNPINHNLSNGKTGVIEVQTGNEPGIKKAKSGHLVVVSKKNDTFIPALINYNND